MMDYMPLENYVDNSIEEKIMRLTLRLPLLKKYVIVECKIQKENKNG